MAKDKKGSKAAAPKADVAKPLESVKAGRVTKPIENGAKEIAKKVANGVEKASKKVKKAVSPEPSDDDTSDSSESSDDEAPKVNGKHAASDSEDDDDDDSASESGSSDDSESDEEVVNKKVDLPKTNGKVNGKAGSASKEDDDSEDDSEDDSDASSDGSDSDDEVAAKAGANADDDDSDASSSDDSEDDVEDKPAAKVEDASKKRKADEAIDHTPKKSKISVNGELKDPTANLFVGNLSWNVDEDWLTREFEEFGELQGVRIITDRDSGRSKGYGYVEFVSADNAAEALQTKQGAPIDGREIRIDFSQGRQQKQFNDGQTPQQRSFDRAARFGDTPREPSMTLFVGNVSFNADESAITEMFQEYGTITGVRLPTDRETGALKGYGYVDYTSIDEAKAAYEALQGADLAGRAMRLDYSTPRSNDSPRGDGKWGRGGGRGGFNDRGRGGFGGRGGGRGGFGDRGGRGGFGGRGGGGRGGRGNSTNRGGFGDFSGKKVTF